MILLNTKMKLLLTIATLLLCGLNALHAQTPVLSSPYNQNGPFTVVTESVTATNPDIYIYRPQQGTGPFPIFIFQPGANALFSNPVIDYSSYEIYMQHLASYGYIVIVIDDATAGFPNGSDFDEAYGWYLQRLNDPNHWMSQIADPSQVIVGGHSLGGVKASDFLQNNKNNIQGIVYFASFPSQGFAGIGAHNIDDYQGKMLTIAGVEDAQSTPADCYEGYESYEQAACRYWVLLNGVGHGGFGDYNNPDQPVGTLGRASVTAAIRHYLVSFMQYAFKGDNVAGEYLNSSSLQVDNTNEFETNCIYLLGESTVCLGDTVAYEIAYNSGNAYCWQVNSGTVVSSGASSLTVLWDTVGVGTVSVRECNRSDYNGATQVSVEAIPNSNFTFTSNDGAFAFQSAGQSNITYSWDFGDGTLATGPSPVHQYTDTGSFVVSLSASSGLCASASTTEVDSDLCPEASFTYNIVNGQVFVQNQSQLYTELLWRFGDNDSSTLENPSPQLADDSTYQFQLIAFNNFCADTITQSVTIGACPEADFDFTANNLEVDFNNLSTDNQTNLWRIDDQDVSADSNLSYTFPDSGQYLVTLVVFSDSNCVDSLSQLVQVNLPAVTDTTTPTDTNVTDPGDTLNTYAPAHLSTQWQVYPNPVDHVLHIAVERYVTYQLINITGKAVDEGHLTGGNHKLSVSLLPAGIYYLVLSADDDKQVVKLVKR